MTISKQLPLQRGVVGPGERGGDLTSGTCRVPNHSVSTLPVPPSSLLPCHTASPPHPSQPAQGSFSHRLFVPAVAANLAGEKPGLEETEGPGRNVG